MSDQAEFYIYDGEEDFVAQVCGPRAEAWAEAMRYASQCDEPQIQEITRAECELGPVPPLKSVPSDTARLEWIEKTGINEAGFEWWECGDLKTYCCISVYHPQSNTTTERRYSGKDFRSMIDAAMADENKPNSSEAKP